MQAPVVLSPTPSITTLVLYAKATAHPYRCGWSGCDALLNCWLNLRKHYHGHCKHATSNASKHGCYLRHCSLDKYRGLTLQELVEHVDQMHLSGLHLPCPATGCGNLELPNELHSHFKNIHNNPRATVSSPPLLAPQATPFHPGPHTSPLPALPQGTFPSYNLVYSMLVLPGSKRQPGLGSSLCLRKPRKPLTFWSCFEFVEEIEPLEEHSMKMHDLGFDPLQHRLSLPDQAWPTFIIPAQAAVPRYPRQVSQPTYLPLPRSQDHSPTILHDAFKKWLEVQTKTKDNFKHI